MADFFLGFNSPKQTFFSSWGCNVRIEEQKVGEERDRVEVGGRERVARVGGDARLVGLLQLYPHRLVEVDLWVQCQSARKGICNTWKKKAVCMSSSWVSRRENCCARRVGGRLGHDPARNAGGVDRRPRQRGASDEHRRASFVTEVLTRACLEPAVIFISARLQAKPANIAAAQAAEHQERQANNRKS